MKRRRQERELILLTVMIAVAVWAYHQAIAPKPETQLPQLSWEEHFQRGLAATEIGEYDQAALELLAAQKLTYEHPAGDDRLARTLEARGNLYFCWERYDLSMQLERDAVAALLLAKGPDDPRVAKWAKRYLWAKSRSSRGLNLFNFNPVMEPYKLILSYDCPAGQERFQSELEQLIETYTNRRELDVVQLLRGEAVR